MVDKCAANISSFNEVFEDAQVQLCIFHAKQAFGRKIRDKISNLTVENKEIAAKIFSSMMFSSSEEEYNELQQKLTDIGNEGLTTYFDANWGNIRETWVGHLVNKMRHCLNRTIGRVESFNRKLKTITSIVTHHCQSFLKKLCNVLIHSTSRKIGVHS